MLCVFIEKARISVLGHSRRGGGGKEFGPSLLCTLLV